MTMIMIHDRFMACDSRVTSGSLVVSDNATPRKVVRCRDGSLVGFMGSITYAHIIRRWVDMGADLDFSEFPRLTLSPEDDPTGYLFAMLRPDGTAHMGDHAGQVHQCDTTEFLSGGQAVAYAFGVFDTLQRFSPALSPRHLVQRVMHQVMERCPTVGGQVHIFDLDHPERDP